MKREIMKKLKVLIQDEYTLVLQEDGSKGDIIDLRTLHDTDIDKTTINNVVNSIKKDAFNDEVKKITESQKEKLELEYKLKEKDISELAKDSIRKLESEILELKSELKSADSSKELAVTKAVSNTEEERNKLKLELSNQEKEIEIMKKGYEAQIKDRDDSIERIRDMKAKQSVKLIGENLEQHCQNEFNSVRTTMFPFAYFEKDNQAIRNEDEAKGTKGDYVYRDYESKGGAEVISIMFEMKDEQDQSVNKKTVESHLKKLDEDRKKKGCEYAILVTTLEANNELYNKGIVNVSYLYNKMFVIRPQFFLPLTTLLKDAGMKSAEDKRQLVLAKNNNIDTENFVDNMENWKSNWLKVMKNAGNKHFEGIEQINKAIKDLEKARDALMMSDKHLLTAENKIEDLTVKRLTKNAPSIADKLRKQD